MTSRLIFLTTVWLSSAAAQFSIIAPTNESILGVATQEILAAKQAVEESAVTVVFSQCQTVKDYFNVGAQALIGTEPDPNEMPVNYYSKTENGTYILSEAADRILNLYSFVRNETLVCYFHGFMEDTSSESVQTVINAYIKRGFATILALNSSSLIRWWYTRASEYVSIIGEKVGQLLAALVKGGLDPTCIHLAGHSLGAHIAGFAGNTFYLLMGRKIPRIDGLDPAGPCFEGLSSDKMINCNNADFVSIIHTDAGVFGLDKQIGHVDIWPNGGSEQPGCLLQTCNHNRAWEFHAESVLNPKAFIGVSCVDWKSFEDGNCNFTDTCYMGFGCQPTTRGKYFMWTNDKSAYGCGEQGLRFENNEGIFGSTL